VHPAARILIFICSALALPGLNLFWTLLLTGILLVAAVPNRLAASWHLLRRSRWLLLLILLGYAYSLPGMAVFASLGEYSPTWPGLEAGGLQVVRLVLLLLLIDRLVLSLSEGQLLAGLHGLFSGLRRLGVDPERLIVRLALTLRLMEANLGRKRGRIDEWMDVVAQIHAGPEQLSIPCLPWRGVDRLALVLSIGVVLLVWLRA